jgi:hypothetical protein
MSIVNQGNYWAKHPHFCKSNTSLSKYYLIQLLLQKVSHPQISKHLSRQ